MNIVLIIAVVTVALALLLIAYLTYRTVVPRCAFCGKPIIYLWDDNYIYKGKPHHYNCGLLRRTVDKVAELFFQEEVE